MHPKLDLFEEFEAVTREEWLADINRHLKGKPLESLAWNINPDLSIEPYPATQTTKNLNLPQVVAQNDWKIVEKIVVKDVVIANKIALNALSWGAESLELELLTILDANDLEQLLKNIELSMIDLVFVGKTIQDSPMNFLKVLHQVTKGKGLQGAVDLGQEASLECILFIKDYMSNISVLNISLIEDGDLIKNIATFLKSTTTCFDTLLEKGLDVDDLSTWFRLKLEVDGNYFLELAKIRAIKRLWLGLLEAYGATKAAFPHIAVTTKSAATDNQHRNMITATTQAMAAAIGGANSILVTPSSSWKNADGFSLRIARNVQHLLKLESYLDRVVDPASGSYYIENISQQIVEKTWLRFQSLV